MLTEIGQIDVKPGTEQEFEAVGPDGAGVPARQRLPPFGGEIDRERVNVQLCLMALFAR